MKAVALISLISLSAFAADPADAPKATVMILGDVAKETGVFLPESLAIEQAKRVKKCEAERAELSKAPPVVGIIIAGVALLGGGIALGYGISQIKK